jgi:hypothetical protein
VTLRGNLALVQTVDAMRAALGSPWANNTHLRAITLDELYPNHAGRPVTRAEAMAVPAMARARHLIVGTGARLPLAVYRAGQPLTEQPAWTRRTDGAQSPVARLAATLDDLLFHGESLWLAERDSEGNVTRAEHVPFEAWTVDADGYLDLLDHGRLDAQRAIHIPGLHEGICTFGADAIRGATATLTAAVDTARHPMRLELHDTGDYPMTRDERAELIADARAAMAASSGVIYTSPGLDSKMHTADAGALLVDGRESFAVDVARLAGVPSAMVDAHARGATMTYSTTADVVQSFLHLGLTLYLTPITARLSLDDVAPRGSEVRFELDAVLGAQALADPNSEPAREPSA